ncbi:MAG: alpha-galactosidase [Kiritimatiellaeota bacterium]|nr:alpha-galactosidase [Kiritimatiellota bacterium]
MSIKIAVIGAGSLGFTRQLTHDILAVPELRETEFALYDINAKNMKMVADILNRDVKANKLKAKITCSTDPKKAFKDADYVINVARVGGLEAFAFDVEIPLKYGVDQCVGDTICAGGIMYGQRGIAAMLGWCDDIREVASPDVLMLNYGNPNAMMTWAANAFGDVPCVGLCHGVQGGHWQIAKVIEFLVNGKGKRKPEDKNYVCVEPKDVDIICAGINHQTWYIQVNYNGEDWCPRLLEGFQKHPHWSKSEKVRIDILKRFGYYSTESNGHLSEYVPWYRKRSKEETAKWIDLSSWINGESGGYLRHCRERRHEFETSHKQILAEKPWDLATYHRSHEHGSSIIESLETGRIYRGHFNVPNEHAITNLAPDSIVEVPGYVDRNGINIPSVGDLPMACAAVCQQSVNVQRLAVHAAVTGDREYLQQALLLDPLTAAVCTPPEVEAMMKDFLVAQAEWLPQYK